MIAIKKMKPYTLHSQALELAIREENEVTVADKHFEF